MTEAEVVGGGWNAGAVSQARCNLSNLNSAGALVGGGKGPGLFMRVTLRAHKPISP